MSTDRLESEAYRSLQPDDVFDLALRKKLHFDHTTETGAVFHMLTALGRHGLIGVTAVGDSREEARTLFERTRDAFDREARAASRARGAAGRRLTNDEVTRTSTLSSPAAQVHP